MRVLLITTWDKACGIAEHSAMLKEAVEAADPSIVIEPCRELDPGLLMKPTFEGCAVVHLNYHAALHSQWTPGWIRSFQRIGKKVLVTGHDTGVPNSDQLTGVIEAADAAVVHEPFDDLPAETTHYWRMGVPGWERPMQLQVDGRPLLGTIGFPFGWKCYDQLAEITAALGWGLLLLAPGATIEQAEGWRARNPEVIVHGEFVTRWEAVSLLSACDATAFTYVTHNTGQSGAVLLGIAARKPVLALATCRQFRALFADPLGRTAITWVDSFEDLQFALSHFVRIERVSPAIVALAEQESWSKLGAKYAQLYRSLA